VTTPNSPESEGIAPHAVIDWHDHLGSHIARYHAPFAHPTHMMPALADYLTDCAERTVAPGCDDFYCYCADRGLIHLDDVRTRHMPVDSTVTYHYRITEAVDFGSAPADPNIWNPGHSTVQVVVQIRASAASSPELPRTLAPWSVLMTTYTTSELYVAAGSVLYHQGMHQQRRRAAAPGDTAQAAELIARAAAYARLGSREGHVAP
jgi:hypothetical protein